MISYLADPGNPDWGAGFYASIADWVAARAGLVMTEDEILECYADWPDNAPLDISGYQTNIQGFLTESGTYKAIIRPKAGAEHNGVRGAGVNIISNGITAELGNVIRLYTDAEVYGIEWRNLGTQTGIRVDSSEARVKIVGNIVTGNTGASRAANGLISLNVANGSSDCVVENNLLFEDGTSGAAIYVDRGAASNIVRNNTVYAMAGSTTEGYRRNTFGTNSEQAYNNVLLTPLGGRSGGTTSVPNTRNNGFQAGATEIVGTSNILDISRSAGVDLTDPANGDFTIASVSSRLYDSGDVPMPLQDIAGNTYSTNDLGAFAFVGGGAVNLIPANLRQEQRLQQATLSQVHKISAQDIRQLQRIEQAILSVTGSNTISPFDIRQDQRLQQAILQQLHTLQPADIRQAQRLQNALVFIPGTPIFPNDIRQGQRIDAAVIDVKSVITPATIRHDQRIEQAILELTRTLQPADIRQNQRLQQATFAGFVVGGLSGKILAYVLLDGSIVVNPDFNQH